MTRRWPTSTAPSNSTPDRAWAITSRGETYRLMERYDEALTDLNRAIELDPDHAWAIASRGHTYGR